MAGKGGGSWKVAYADFVTAMMAFFLVMWIGAQDQKTRQSVANYFLDPSGVSKKPAKSGAILDTVQYGNLPDNEKNAMGRGRHTFSPPKEPSPATKLVNDWLHSDEALLRRWREQAQACRELAAKSPEVVNQQVPLETIAVKELATRFQLSVGNDANKLKGLYQEMFMWSLKQVNWEQLAEDLLRG